ASAIMKDPATYEHVAPERIGNKRKLIVSDQSGRSNLQPSQGNPMRIQLHPAVFSAFAVNYR
ncbi:MAG: hypothetical protein ACLQVG_32620, partial [Terriglobia bacterium]